MQFPVHDLPVLNGDINSSFLIDCKVTYFRNVPRYVLIIHMSDYLEKIAIIPNICTLNSMYRYTVEFTIDIIYCICFVEATVFF